MNISNGTGAAVRADLNNALQAIATNNSGSSAPSATFPFMLFADTSTGTMKIRNAENNGFIELFQLDGTFTIENGTEGTPGLAFRTALTTGIYLAGTNELAISTAGAEACKFLANNNAIFNNSIQIKGELDFIENNNKFIDFQTLDNNKYVEFRHFNNAGDTFESFLKSTANGAVEIANNGIAMIITKSDGVNFQHSASAFYDFINTGAGTLTGATRLRFLEGVNSRAELVYSHDNDQLEIIANGSNEIKLVTDAIDRLNITHGASNTKGIAHFGGGDTTGRNGNVVISGSTLSETTNIEDRKFALVTDGAFGGGIAMHDVSQWCGFYVNDSGNALNIFTSRVGTETPASGLVYRIVGNGHIWSSSNYSNTTPGLGDTDTGFTYEFGNGAVFISRGSNSVQLFLNSNTSSATSILDFNRNGSAIGSITHNGGSDVSYNPFTGGHYGRLEDRSNTEILEGTIIELVDKPLDYLCVTFDYQTSTETDEEGNVTPVYTKYKKPWTDASDIGKTVTFTYEGKEYSGIVESEFESGELNQHQYTQICKTAESTKCFGLFMYYDENDKNSRHYTDNYNDMLVAGLGDYFIRMAKDQTPAIGDFIVSDANGCGIVQSDDVLRSKTVAKIKGTTKLKTYSDGTFLVACTVHCG